MVTEEYCGYQIFRMWKIGILEFYVVLAIMIYICITCVLFALVKKRKKLLLTGFMVFPMILFILAGISMWYGFWSDVGSLLKLTGYGMLEGYIFTWIISKAWKLPSGDGIGESNENRD